MKFLILFACIAAASAIGSFYPRDKEYTYDYYKYPATEKYYKDYPMYEYYGREFPWYSKYLKDLLPYYEQSYKGLPYYENYRSEVPRYGKYFKDYPMYAKYYKEYPMYPMTERYMRDLPMTERYSSDLPMTERYSRDLPMSERYISSLPTSEKYIRDLPIGEKYIRDLPISETYMKGLPMSEKYIKDFPMYEKMFKEFNLVEFFGTKDITVVKKDFILFYYKYLVEILDLFKARFGDILTHADTFKFDQFSLPMKCTKLTGMFRWMMLMNIDYTKKDVPFFDYFMVCKMVDYVMFIKNYFLHFNIDVMYKDFGLIKDLYGMIGDQGYGLYKYYGDVFGRDFYKYETPLKPQKLMGGMLFTKY